MSEKGQGEESAGTGAGAGIGVAGGAAAGAAAGGGSQADQSGPHDGTVPTDQAIEDALKAYEDRERERTFEEGLGKPELPDLPEEADAEPDVTWRWPDGHAVGLGLPAGQDGPRGDPPEAQGEPAPEQPAAEVEEEGSRPKRRRGRKRAGDASADSTCNPPGPDPKAVPTDRPPGLSDEEFEEFKKKNPSALDKANTQTNVT